jgi:hypothetical protein
VPQPELYRQYRLDEAVSFFGSNAEAESLCDGQWLIFPNAVICLAKIGAPPQASHFGDASEFCWVADKPYRVNDEGDLHFVPAQVLDQRGEHAIHLFLSSAQSPDYRYVGELAAFHRGESGSREHHGMACFRLTPTVPSSVLVQLCGLQLGSVDFVAVDQALARLRGPTTVQDRLGVLQELVQFWHGPIGPGDGMDEDQLAGIPMPQPLRWWYRWAGKRHEILSGQNILLEPRELKVDDGRLRFYVENQYVYQWGTLLEGDDPPVFGRYDDGDPWEVENLRLSEHLILACLFEAVFCHVRYSASAAWLEERKLAEIIKTIPPVAIGSWGWCETRFFAARGAFMVAAVNDVVDGQWEYSVWIGAKTEHPLQFLRHHIDERWDIVTI